MPANILNYFILKKLRLLNTSLSIENFLGNPNFKMIEGDITNLENCMEACKEIDVILHQAALGSVPRSIENPLKTNDININGFINILWAAKKENISRIVYAASSSTYGDSKKLPKIENEIGSPLSPYAGHNSFFSDWNSRCEKYIL